MPTKMWAVPHTAHIEKLQVACTTAARGNVALFLTTKFYVMLFTLDTMHLGHLIVILSAVFTLAVARV